MWLAVMFFVLAFFFLGFVLGRLEGKWEKDKEK